MQTNALSDALRAIRTEVKYTMAKHSSSSSSASAHEALASILEELDDLKKLVQINQELHNPTTLRTEAKRVAAIAVRIMIEAHYT